MVEFLYGMNCMGFLIAGLFFLRFWQKTAEPLFAAFGAAFFCSRLINCFMRCSRLRNRSKTGHSFSGLPDLAC